MDDLLLNASVITGLILCVKLRLFNRLFFSQCFRYYFLAALWGDNTRGHSHNLLKIFGGWSDSAVICQTLHCHIVAALFDSCAACVDILRVVRDCLPCPTVTCIPIIVTCGPG